MVIDSGGFKELGGKKLGRYENQVQCVALGWI